MAGKLNRVYVDGLTRFETNQDHKEKEKVIITQKVDDSAGLMEKYSKKNIHMQIAKKNEFDKYCDIGRSLNAVKTEGKRKNIELGHKYLADKEIKDQQKCIDKSKQKLGQKQQIKEVDEREMISKSADKYRGWNNQYPCRQKMTTQGQFQNLKNDFYMRERINTYNYPSQEPTQLKTYRDAYPTDRSHQQFKERQAPHKEDLYSKYPLPSMRLLNQQQIMNTNIKQINYGLKQKQLLYSNRKTIDTKQTKVRQPIVDRHNDIFKQIQERTKRDKDRVYQHLQKQYAKDIQKAFQRPDRAYKRQILRDYSQQFSKKPNNVFDKQYPHRKQIDDGKYQRESPSLSVSPRPRAYQQYCNQYSKFSKDLNLGQLKPTQKIFNDKTNFNRQFQLLNNRFQKYQRQYEYAKISSISPMKNYGYDQNVYNKGVNTKRDVRDSQRERERIPNFGYRGNY